MEHFGLSLEKEKSRLIEFGRFAEERCSRRYGKKPETFTFLGFTHNCSKSRNGKFRVKRKTSEKKFNKKIKEMDKEIRERLTVFGLRAPEVIKWLNQVLVGYFHYLRYYRQPEDAGELCVSNQETTVQVAEQTESEKELHMGELYGIHEEFPAG